MDSALLPENGPKTQRQSRRTSWQQGGSHVAIAAALVLAIIALTGISELSASPLGQPPNKHGGGVISLLAVDAVVDGNSATAIGNVDPCIEVTAGGNASLDVVVDAVPETDPMVLFEVHVFYDDASMSVTANNFEMLLAASPGSMLAPLSDSVPDTGVDDREQRQRSGRFVTTAFDLNRADESGPGVLARLTFTASQGGVDTPPGVYPVGLQLDILNTSIIADIQGEIPLTAVQSASITVDQRCSSAPSPPVQTTIPPGEPTATAGGAATTPATTNTGGATDTATPTEAENGGRSDDSGGFPWTTVAAIAGGSMAAILTSGILYQMWSRMRNR